MRNKLAYFLISFSCIVSCDKSQVDPGTSVITTLPVPPTKLNVTQLGSTKLSLTWTDNSTNEDGFKIERKSGTGNYSLINSVGSNITSYIDSNLIFNTLYTYRVFSFNSAGNSPTYSNEFSITTIGLPILNTSYSSLTQTTILCSGDITNDGGSNIIKRGICWGTKTLPTVGINDTLMNGIGSGIYSIKINSLSPNTKYFIRAFAVNNSGLSYGNEISVTTPDWLFVKGAGVTDVSGNSYESVIIGSQEWMSSNLRTNKFADGSIIESPSTSTWLDITTPAWCYYNNDPTNNNKHGKLYNFYAVEDKRNVCPVGWHVPTGDDWTKLALFMGVPAKDIQGVSSIGYGTKQNVGKALTSTDFTGQTPSTKIGLNLIGSGQLQAYWYSSNNAMTRQINFEGISARGIYWANEKINMNNYVYVGSRVFSGDSSMFNNFTIYGQKLIGNNFNSGYSIRCIKN